MEEKRYLFENLKNIKDYWVQTSLKGLEKDTDFIWSECEKEYRTLQHLLKNEEDKESYEKILNEVIEGVLHSLLVMVDGGDDLADHYTVDLIVEKNNKSLKYDGALHEDFFEYLLDVEE